MQNKIKNIYEYILEECAHELRKSNEEFRKEKYKNTISEKIINTSMKKSNDIIKRNKEYLSKLKESLEKLDKEVIIVDAETKTRCLVNTSSPFAWLVDEVGLEWDPILDTPYIPATEIKGAVSAVLQFEDETLRDLLGSSGDAAYKSLIDFTNAYPIGFSQENTNLLERDVITPIYGEDKIKEHEATPVPVQFVTIAPGVKFRFFVTIDKPRLQSLLKLLGRLEKSPSEKERLKEKLEALIKKLRADPNNLNNVLSKIREKVLESIREAFEKWGIGAKTSSGYGRFRICER